MSSPSMVLGARNSLLSLAAGGLVAGSLQIDAAMKKHGYSGFGKSGIASTAIVALVMGVLGAAILAFMAPETSTPSEPNLWYVGLAGIGGLLSVHAVAYGALSKDSFDEKTKKGIDFLAVGAAAGGMALGLSF